MTKEILYSDGGLIQGVGSLSPGSSVSFMSDGASIPWGGSSAAKNAFYDATNDRTWFFWEAWDRTLAKRVIKVRTYTPAGGWTNPVLAGANSTIGNDIHGSPDAVRDPTRGHVYLFYGAHESNVQYSYTTNADDPSAWTTGSLSSGTYGNFTFVSAFVSGATLYLFYDTLGSGGGLQQAIKVTTATIASDGSLTWSGTTKSLIDVSSGATGWIYPGQFSMRSGKIYFCFSYSATFAGPVWENVYVVVYDPATGSISNFTGGFSVASGSQPANKATMDANFIAVSYSGIANGTNFAFDSSGTIHLVYEITSGSPQLVVENYINNSGSGWSSPVAIASAPVANYLTEPCIVPKPDDSMDVYYGDGTAGGFGYAAGIGNIWRTTRSAGGSWSSAVLIASYLNYGMSAAVVVGGSAAARVVFSENTEDGLLLGKTLRGYAYGDDGFLGQPALVDNHSPFSVGTLNQGAVSFLNFERGYGDISWREPQGIYINGTDTGVGTQTAIAYDNLGVNRTALYSDGTQYWNIYSGAQIGSIGYSTPGGFPGIAMWSGVYAKRAMWVVDGANNTALWGMAASDTATYLMGLDTNANLKLKSSGMFAFSSTSLPTGGVDLAIARNGAGVAEINTGVAGTFADLKVRSLLPAAGTASIAPMTLTAGTNLTTAVAGAIEFDGKAFYDTAVASSRQVRVSEQVQNLSSNRTFTNNTSAQAIFNATANGAVTLAGSTTYEFEMLVAVSGLSSSAHTVNLTFAGTATFTSIGYFYEAQAGSTLAGPTATLTGFVAVATATAVIASSTTTGLLLLVRGTMRINAGGTVIPQLTQVTNSAAAVVQANSYFRCWPIGSNTVASVGNWS